MITRNTKIVTMKVSDFIKANVPDDSRDMFIELLEAWDNGPNVEGSFYSLAVLECMLRDVQR